MIVNSKEMTLSLPKEKCLDLHRKQKTPVLKLTKPLGHLTSIIKSIHPAKLQFRYVQLEQIKEFFLWNTYQTTVKLGPIYIEELEWWIGNICLSLSRSLIQHQPQKSVQTYASKPTWGAVLKGVKTGGVWSSIEIAKHFCSKIQK